jgi:HK97 family phage major capsid protein
MNDHLDPYASSRYDPLTRHVVNLNEAGQLRESAARLVAESAAMFKEANERTAGRRYSVARVINAAITGARLDGIEREVSEELAQHAGIAHSADKPWIPWHALAAQMHVSQRTMLTGTAAQGGNLVAKGALDAVAALTPYMTTLRLGVEVIDGLRGNVFIPRVTTSGTAVWPGEAGTAAASDQVFAQFEAAPKKVIAVTDVSKVLLSQAPMIADRVIATDLLGIVGRELDKATLSGTGTDQPLGIRNTSGVTLTTGTAFDHAAAQAMLKNVATANVNDENVRFLRQRGGRLHTSEALAPKPLKGDDSCR